jgi:aryl-alcohol dehydrogenase-like predicted oxidoreductase
MQHRHLGRSGIAIPPLMIGGNVFGWTADAATSYRLLDAMADAGLTAIDTADMYSTWIPGHHGGESETVIGDWLARRGKRDEIVIATKVGSPMPDGTGLSRAWILRACDDSLRRLRTDRIDLYQAHQDDPATPLEETLSAFAELMQAGKVRAIGASNHTADRLREALHVSAQKKLPRYESLQPHYNLLERAEFEGPLEDLCRSENLGVIPYFSLAAGFLTGKYRSEADLSQSPRGGGVAKYLDARGRRVLAALDTVAVRRSASPAAAALAWLIARPSITAPIASATRLDQVDDLVRATQLDLDREDIETLNEASTPA